MTLNELIELVTQELDTSYALPMQLQPNEIERIINQEKVWFYENYREAVESRPFIIKANQFHTPEWRATRTATMPDCVVSVTEVKEITGAGLLGTVDRDFADNKLIASEIYLSPITGESLVFRIAQYQFFDLTRAFFLEWIRYDFNRRTHRLKFLGRDPVKDVYLNTYVRIPDEYLFEDYYFQRWVTAKSKIALGRMLGFFNYQLMGNITVNHADIKSEGENEIQQLREEIKEQDPPDYFLTYH